MPIEHSHGLLMQPGKTGLSARSASRKIFEREPSFHRIQ
jgi:hypothetical protein